MTGRAIAVAVCGFAGAAALSVACLTSQQAIRGPPPEVPYVSPIPSAQGPGSMECRVELVPVPSKDTVQVGVLDIPAQRRTEVVLDEEYRRQACELGASEAVQESTHTDKSGEQRWVVRLYRKKTDPGAQPFQAEKDLPTVPRGREEPGPPSPRGQP